MATPEKHDNSESFDMEGPQTPPPSSSPPPGEDKDGAPELDAILPDKSRLSSDDVIRDLESYQKKMEEEWEQAKTSHQDKINQIMSSYLKEKFIEDFETPPSFTKDSPPPKRKKETEKHFDYKEPDTQKMKSLLREVQKVLGESEPRTKKLMFWDDVRQPVINASPWTLRLWNHRRVWASALILLVGAGLLWHYFSPYKLKSLTPLPYTHPTGPVFKNNQAYIVDWFRKAVYVHAVRKNFQILSVENIPNSFITGFDFSKENLWTLDGFNNQILKHTLTEEHRVLEKGPSPGPKPVGLVWDGKDIWVGDNSEKSIYKIKGNDLESITKEFKISENITITALTLTNNKIWILDGNTREVFVYRLQNPLKKIRTFDLDPFMAGSSPTGLALRNKTVWVIANNPSRLIKISKRALEKARTNIF